MQGFAAAMTGLAVAAMPATVGAQQQAVRSSPDATVAASSFLPPTQGTLGHPYLLPPASRARMHACGIEWQKRKMAGTAGDEVWRVFASQCLVAPDKDTLAAEHALEIGRSQH